jgi:hypothetical protein
MFGNKLARILGGLSVLVAQLEKLVKDNEKQAQRQHDIINVHRATIARKQEAIKALDQESEKALKVAANVRRLMGEDVAG